MDARIGSEAINLLRERTGVSTLKHPTSPDAERHFRNDGTRGAAKFASKTAVLRLEPCCLELMENGAARASACEAIVCWLGMKRGNEDV
jgi:hypothetical protein